MLASLTRGDHVAQWSPDHAMDSSVSPCPLYSGQLLKLGSNERWQSRLFTFDGEVLTCVGKKPSPSPIATNDPHTSSTFVPVPRHPQLYNPNMKWSIGLDSITDIRLQKSPRTYRCLPYGEASLSLFLETIDGRTLTLRAKKGIELERWYFILSKIWSYHRVQHQQRRDTAYFAEDQCEEHKHRSHHHQPYHHRPPLSPHNKRGPLPGVSQLPAHQQSLHLFNKYLQCQQEDNHNPQGHQPGDPRLPQHQHHPLRSIHYRSSQNQEELFVSAGKGREILLQSKISPPRVSALLLQGIDRSLQRKDEGEKDHVESEGEGEDIRAFMKTYLEESHLPGSAPSDWPALGSLEPAKAAAIEMWRRNLIPFIHTDDLESLIVARATKVKVLVGGASRPSGDSCDEAGDRDKISGFTYPQRDDQGHDERIGPKVHGRSKWPLIEERHFSQCITAQKASPSQKVWFEGQECRPFISYHYSRQHGSQHDDVNVTLAMTHQRGGERTTTADTAAITGLGIRLCQPSPKSQRQESSRVETKEENLEPEGMNVNRSMCWKNTQLSSVDDSGTNRSSFVALTATTPDLCKSSYPTVPNRNSHLSLHALLARRYASSNSRTVSSNNASESVSPKTFVAAGADKPPMVRLDSKGVLDRILVRPSLTRLETHALEAIAVATTTCSRSSEEEATANVNRPRRPSIPRSSSSLSDPSVSFHGSSYSYLPIHDPEFAFGQATVDKETPQMQTHSESKDFSATVQVIEGTMTTTTTATPTCHSPSDPPVRPPRRRPVTIQKNVASSSLSLSLSLSLSNSALASNISRSPSSLRQLTPASRPTEKQLSNATLKLHALVSSLVRPSSKALDRLPGLSLSGGGKIGKSQMGSAVEGYQGC